MSTNTNNEPADWLVSGGLLVDGSRIARRDLTVKSGVIDEIPRLVDMGVTSFKMYMTYPDIAMPDDMMLEVMSLAAEHGGLAMVHAENGFAIDHLVAALVGEDLRSLSAQGHPITRLGRRHRPVRPLGPAHLERRGPALRGRLHAVRRERCTGQAGLFDSARAGGHRRRRAAIAAGRSTVRSGRSKPGRLCARRASDLIAA